MALSIWTEEISEALRAHIAAGTCFRIAAEELSRTFGVTISRNAAIGRGARMGLPQPERLERPKKTVRVRRVPVSKIVHNGAGLRLVESSAFVTSPKLRCAEIVPLNLTFEQLEPRHCHYPYGDGPFLFCGHLNDGSSYCASHHALCMEPSKPRRILAWSNAA